MSLGRPTGPAARRTAAPPRFQKPPESYCTACSLGQAAGGFVPSLRRQPPAPVPRPKILLVGEAPGYDEGLQGEPFVGAAGSMLSRVLKLIGTTRETYDFANVYSCVLPGGTSERQSWAYSAREACRYIQDALDTAPAVVVPLGGVAIRRVLDLFGHKDVKVDGFHGTVTRSADDRYWIVPGYHPSYLQRGAVNLMGVASFDLTIAHEVAEKGWAADPMQLVIDPPVDWFRAYADQYLAAVRQDPFAYPLANDIETPDKASDEAEDLAAGRDKSYRIIRQNLCCDPNLGVTIPWEEPWRAIAIEMLEAGGLQYLWHKAYDVPRQLADGIRLNRRRLYDGMWMAKALQSDLPGGLGFWAPFYSRFGAWKHLAHVDPRRYACIDGPQTRRVCDGLVADLEAAGMWSVFGRHQHDFHGIILQPATEVGVPIDRPRLAAFKDRLEGEATRLMAILQAHAPAEVCPVTPKPGLTRPPLPGDVHTKARATKRDGTLKKKPLDPLKAALYEKAVIVEKLVIREVWQCQACDAVGVLKTHRCEDSRSSLWEIEGGTAPDLLKKVAATVTRWFWQEPFNPDSSQQMLALLKAWKLPAGQNKHTKKPSVDRETLSRLLAKTKGTPQGEFFAAKLDYGAVVKVRSTYVVGTEKRLDEHDRLHGEVTFKPSTMRTSMVAPNIQNVVADKQGKESLAAGFRRCVVARGQQVEEGSEYADD